jgi:hypothetical protein
MLLRETTARHGKVHGKISAVLVFYELFYTYKDKVNVSLFTSGRHIGGKEV